MPHGPRLVAAHLNYRLRGRDSLEDQRFVEKLCSRHHVPLEILDLGKSFGQTRHEAGNLEEKCRRLRYLFLEEIRRRHRAKAVLVAHQLNDQLETFLLNLTRGSSLNGFRAMRDYDPSRHLLRPLLQTTKKEILSSLTARKLPYRLDRSNLCTHFKRNLIRSRVIPALQQINPSLLETAGQSLRDLAENLELIQTITRDWLDSNLLCQHGQFSFPLKNLLEQPAILQKHILRALYGRLHGGSLTGPALDELLATLRKQRSGLRKEFGPQTMLHVTCSEREQKSGKKKRMVVLEHEFN